jgi:hypothetical protein
MTAQDFRARWVRSLFYFLLLSSYLTFILHSGVFNYQGKWIPHNDIHPTVGTEEYHNRHVGSQEGDIATEQYGIADDDANEPSNEAPIANKAASAPGSHFAHKKEEPPDEAAAATAAATSTASSPPSWLVPVGCVVAVAMIALVVMQRQQQTNDLVSTNTSPSKSPKGEKGPKGEDITAVEISLAPRADMAML